jgi:hypothetical protein
MMGRKNTLANKIIFGSVQDVANHLHAGIQLDKVDEYGYSPLIQTAIVNDAKKAKLIIDAGASVDFTDLTGRTALHWAADNHNLELATLLLDKGADANAYTRAGQPVLVLPYLRNQKQMKELLYRYGGELDFAQDFINGKMLGHVYELEGRVDLVDTKHTFFEIEFEGFYLEFSLAMAAKSLNDFLHNYGSRRLRRYSNHLQVITDTIKNGAELIKFQHYLVDVGKNETEINRLLTASPLLIPVASDGHAIGFIKYGDMLIRTDRGAYGRDHGTVIFYQIGRPEALNKSVIKSLLYRRQQREFINQGLVDMLELEPLFVLPLPVQMSGNCAWANIEAVIPAMLMMQLLNEKKSHTAADRAACQEVALTLYHEWLKWDKNRTLDYCIDNFAHADPMRQASIAEMLAAALFQRCVYKDPDDRRKAEKILQILTIEDYQYILKAYFKIFLPLKNEHQQIKNLLEFLEEFGIDKKLFSES